jgi:hypothetical protein
MAILQGWKGLVMQNNSQRENCVVWLSAWTGYFKLGFYFTEKSGKGIAALNISESLKKSYETHKPIGRLKPLVAEVNKRSQLKDIYALLRYKVGK